MKHNLLKSVILSVILLMGVSNAWAEPWLCRSTAGGKIATKTVGDKLNNGNEWNYEYTTNGGWSSATDIQVYVGTSTSSYTAVNAGWKSDDGGNKNVAANIGGVSFDKSGKWYAVGKYKADGKTAYTTKKDEWTNNTTLSMGSNNEPYWEVTPPAVSNFTVSVSGYLSGTGTSNDPYIVQYGKALTVNLSGSKAKTDANSTLQYNTSGRWNTTTSRTISNITSATKTSVTVKMRCHNSTASLSGTESSKTIYYRSEDVYTVTFDANGHGTAPESQKISAGGKATTPTAPTATGYTFGGWYREAGCTNAFDFNTAINANITLYAKWTVNQYTLTYIAGAGGTVTATVGGNPISSPASLDYNTQVVLTATPDGENAFAQWVDGDGNQLSTANPYTHTFEATTTIKAVFSVPTTVYLKPSDAWKADNAHFAIYSWGGVSADTWVDLVAADCEGTYYKADVPAGFSDFAFVRLKPVGADGYSSENDGHNWTNKWDQTGNLSIQTNGKNMYDIDDKTMTYIHLEAKAWDNGDARFAAYFFGNGNEWVNLTKNGDVYSCKKPEGYTSVIFCRMNKNNADNNFNNCWNKTRDLSLMDNGDNCFWINTDSHWGCAGTADGNVDSDSDGKIDGADGGWYRVWDNSQWTNETPSFTVTLEPSQYGYYTIEYNGLTYKSLDKDTVRFKATVGSTIKINDGVPYNSAYNNEIIMQESTGGTIHQHVQNTTHTICGHTAIDENFVTKEAHKVYLAIPKDLETTWNNNATANYTYSMHNMEAGADGKLTLMTAVDPSEFCANSNYVYYSCELPAGYHTFRFERKASDAKYTPRQSYTEDFIHAAPFSNGNCYTITKLIGTPKEKDQFFEGYWSMPPADGDYRLIYVEQVVQKSEKSGEDWKTIVKRTKCHPSDIVRKNTATTSESIVSLHVYKKGQNPEVILQQFSCAAGDWVDIEAHMVNGPLETTPNMGMLPGRKNAGSNSDVDDFVYDNGIERIKNDTEKDGRVWNFTIKQYNNGDKATLILDDNTKFYPYEGQYYIRTLDALGGWIDYTIPANYVNYSHYADTAGYFTHYFCKYIHENTDVTFVIANDYGQAITDTLYIDRDFYGKVLANPMVGATGKLPAQDANVRFSWDEETNITSRAYIAGAFEGLNEYLVVEGENISIPNVDGNKDNYFRDNTNWLYYIDIDAKTTAQATVKAKYNSVYQYFRGTDSAKEPLIGGSNTDNTSYPIRILYDFKEHRFIIAYRPPTTIQGDVAIETPVMIIRKNHEAPNQITFNSNERTITAPMPAYAVMTFVEDFLKDASKTKQEKMLYWVSFPFDVKIQDVFGLGNYGTHWVMEYYDGQQRAIEGLNIYNTFWRYITDTEETLQAGKGYVLCLNVDRIVGETFLDGNNAKEEISLYFPSAEAIDESTIKSQGAQTVNIPTWTGAAEEKDHNWNLIGVISYANTGESTQQSNTNFLYEYDASSDTYSPQTSSGYTFNALHAYMVQYGGDISWTSHIAPQAIAAKHNTYGTSDKYILCLDLINKGKTTDQTFIQLQEEDATAMFDLNQDMMKIFNSGANIYSIANTNNGPYELAGNALPVEETIIPLGLKLDAAGEYTFAMPDGTDGITVELIDYENNTRTNMLLDDYTVNLTAGTNEARFALHVKPDKTATNVEHITTPSCSDIRKFIIDGVLYMQKDGILYDAQGHIVR